MPHVNPLQSLSDEELPRSLSEILQQSRQVEAELVAHIGEVGERRLYAREACSSMFAYCTEVLHLSEAEAYLRIAVARAARKYPMLLVMLGEGRLHLSGNRDTCAAPHGRELPGDPGPDGPQVQTPGSRSWLPSFRPSPTYRRSCESCSLGR
jgi:hypothetical protein